MVVDCLATGSKPLLPLHQLRQMTYNSTGGGEMGWGGRVGGSGWEMTLWRGWREGSELGVWLCQLLLQLGRESGGNLSAEDMGWGILI